MQCPHFGRTPFTLIFFLVLGALFPELFASDQATSRREYEYLYWLVGFGAYTIFETILLNVFGTTLGKVLYRIRLRDLEGKKFGFTIALKRSLAVWVRGFGFGIPLVTLITLLVAFRTLRTEGKACTC
jgi:uncharacterized RDD family membrane protein YckC